MEDYIASGNPGGNEARGETIPTLCKIAIIGLIPFSSYLGIKLKSPLQFLKENHPECNRWWSNTNG
jgi:hypothetical protein